jgi:hypothetical protein
VRAWVTWVAAVLLLALALTGGPDALDTNPSPAHAQVAAVEIGDDRGPGLGDDPIEPQHRLADRETPGHRLAALPPAAQTNAPVPVRGVSQAVPPAVQAAAAGRGARPRLGACTPEALQIFRC